MNDLIEKYMSFLNKGKTERECVRNAVALAEEKGFRDIATVSSLHPGDRVYIRNYDKAVAFFHIGKGDITKGMNILGAHIDSPRLDIKLNPLYESEGIVYLDTHYYGGIKKYQWVTLPLAIHGVVCKTDGTVINLALGEDDDDFTFCISDILPHIAQEQMKKTASEFIAGEDLDLIAGLGTPEKGDREKKDKAKKAVLSILKERYNIDEKDFLSAELEVVPAGKAKYLGLDRSMVLSYGQDDRICAFTTLDAFLEGETEERTGACLLVDKEEIGSTGATGMNSLMLENCTAEVLEKMGGCSSIALSRTLRNSMMLSADVNSAFDPLNSSLYDSRNSSYLSRGVVFNKYTGARGKSGANDANPEFIAKIRCALEKKNISYQVAEMSKVDVGGGGTIAKFCAFYGMQVIDCGVPIMSMHAPWEISSVRDIESARETYGEFLKIV